MIQVIVCDDHTLLRRGIVNVINNIPGCSVVAEINDGIHLMPLFVNGFCADLVVLDIAMPLVDGYKAAALLSASFPTVKILAVSMCCSMQSVEGMLKVGARGFITKEGLEEELAEAIQGMHYNGYYVNKNVSYKMVMAAEKQQAAFKKSPYPLTSKEMELLPLLCSDHSYKQIADEKNINIKTIDKHKESICRKLNVKTRTGLSVLAMKMGLIKI